MGRGGGQTTQDRGDVSTADVVGRRTLRDKRQRSVNGRGRTLREEEKKETARGVRWDSRRFPVQSPLKEVFQRTLRREVVEKKVGIEV